MCEWHCVAQGVPLTFVDGQASTVQQALYIDQLIKLKLRLFALKTLLVRHLSVSHAGQARLYSHISRLTDVDSQLHTCQASATMMTVCRPRTSTSDALSTHVSGTCDKARQQDSCQSCNARMITVCGPSSAQKHGGNLARLC